ncbi:Site-specific recombinase XerD [Hymenobacter daecheongensis DSM 21074]|uniref:Site-specific recombinase XerD n=1 Tax=Hymenobacter daecheongensis DSM 21074 TaxID=1121955 RepID=A0A1M6EXR6_9BACT|nr:site-specific integrase [Hymenobacter daecheongensis]SHI90225.1 Site-specific recombinase XerD [Hymenobacter daecheongensis DSM 21074]
MASTKLVIRSDRKNFGKTTIYVQYTHKSIKKKFSTSISVEPERWNVKGQKIIGSTTEVTENNLTIQAARARIDQIVRHAIMHGEEPTFALVEERLKQLLSPTPAGQAAEQKSPQTTYTSFLELFASYIEATSSMKAHGTVKHYKSTLNHLHAYANKKRLPLSLAQVDTTFYHDFVQFLTQDLAMTNGTANNQLKRVKVVMGYAIDQGLTDNLAFRKFKLLKHTEADVVYLTKQELQTLFEADLSTEPRLAKVRDLFVLACTTGLRYSDFSTIHPNNIVNDQLVLRTVKTRDWLRVDLNQYSRAILECYPDGLPKLSQQKFNDYVKDLGQHCGIDKSTLVVRYQGSKRVEERVPKYTLLSSHTGRRTFVTQSLERGMGVEVVQKFTGHKDLKTVMRYAKVADEQKKSQMNKAWG